MNFFFKSRIVTKYVQVFDELCESEMCIFTSEHLLDIIVRFVLFKVILIKILLCSKRSPRIARISFLPVYF